MPVNHLRKRRTIAVVCVLLTGIVISALQFIDPNVNFAESDASDNNGRIPEDRAREAFKGSSRQRSSAETKRGEVFNELLAEWKATTMDKDGFPTSNIGPLIEKSASMLLCTQEMLSLLETLQTSGYQVAARSLHEHLISKLGSDDGQVYRSSILEIKDKSNPYARQWIYTLGTKSRDNELNEYKFNLRDNSDFSRSLLVREIAKAKNPEIVVKEIISTIPRTYFDSPQPTQIISYPLFGDIIRNLPENSDWSELFRSVPFAEGGRSCPSNVLRQNIISRWSRSDFASAAAGIIKGGDEESIGELRSMEITDDNRQVAISYLQSLSSGSAADMIAESIARSYLTTDLEKAREFADQIRDSIQREKVVQDIVFDLGTSGNRGN